MAPVNLIEFQGVKFFQSMNYVLQKKKYNDHVLLARIINDLLCVFRS